LLPASVGSPWKCRDGKPVTHPLSARHSLRRRPVVPRLHARQRVQLGAQCPCQ
jgi:hypothetical protein